MADEFIRVGSTANAKRLRQYGATNSTEVAEVVAVDRPTIVKATVQRSSALDEYSTGALIASATTTGLNLSFASCAAYQGGGGLITAARLLFNRNHATNPQVDLWLFNATVAVDGDIKAWTPTSAELTNLVGIVQFQTPFVAATASGSSGSVAYEGEFAGARAALPFVCGSADVNLYGVPRMANTPTLSSNAQFEFQLTIGQG